MSNRIDFRVVRRLARIIRENDYKLVHAHTPRSVLVARAAAAVARVPVVYHVHSPTRRDSTHRWQNHVNHWIERLSLLGVPALITVSESLRRHMIAAGYAAPTVFTVPNGVPAAVQRRGSTAPGAVWTIGTAALFRPRKGIEVLLEALAVLDQLRFPVQLLAVGPFESAQYEREVMQRVHQLRLEKRIEWTGFTTDVSAQLARMDVFVLPSLFGEGLPMVVLEAMAAGVPVVAARVEGIPEAIEDGMNGLLADASDADDLARCIARLVRHEVDWHTLRSNALRTHAERFSDRAMAQRVAAVYHTIGSRSHKPDAPARRRPA
jgi:glycosyltransferase involved in cell wall biosynthesis